MNDFEKNNFANFEASKAMKAVGFDEPCFTAYLKSGHLLKWWDFGDIQPGSDKMAFVQNSAKDNHIGAVGAPLFQQARKWVRENHGLDVAVEWYGKEFRGFIGRLSEDGTSVPTEFCSREYPTEPDAYNAAIIKACQIVKENKQ